MKEQQYDFFITYSGKDENWAKWIATALEASGYTTTIQAWDFRPGDNFMAAMDHALATCRHTLGVLSPNYLASVFTRAEWTAALAYIDLVDIEESEGRRRLLDGVAERVDRE